MRSILSCTKSKLVLIVAHARDSVQLFRCYDIEHVGHLDLKHFNLQEQLVCSKNKYKYQVMLIEHSVKHQGREDGTNYEPKYIENVL